MRATLIGASLVALLLSACSEAPSPVPQPGPAEDTDAVQQPVDEPPPAPGDPGSADAPEPAQDQAEVVEPAPPAPSPEELAAVEEADRERRERVERLFNEVMEPVTEAVEAYDAHDELDEDAWFAHDQEDNQEDIDDLLDDAIKVLGISEISDTRSEMRRLEAEIVELEEQLIDDREARLGAPRAEDLNALQKTYTTSREEYDERIDQALNGIDGRRGEIAELELDFVRRMRAIGVDLDLEAAKSLLSTVTGDDFIEMCVVFDNVRGVTVQLQELTEASGESLDAARRYYGSYVVLIHIMDRIQKDFVRRVNEEMIPRLHEYDAQARQLIIQARENMAQGGDRAIGEQNIASNELTIHATSLYIEYLTLQAAEVQARNQRLQVDLRDAKNTYDTVVLSSEVANLLREGSRNFAALLRLDVPSLRGFENAELKAEFERLTRKMTRLD